MKKLLACVLAVTMTFAHLCSLPADNVQQSSVITAAASASQKYSYEPVSGGGAKIISASVSGAVTIPSTLGGRPVTAIGTGAFADSPLTSVTLPSTLRTIEAGAFSRCTSLTSLALPQSVTSVGEEAFYGCTALRSVNLSGSLKALSERMFAGCTSLSSVTVPSGTTAIGKSAFEGCTSLATAIIPTTVTSVGSSAFWGCSALNTVTLPSSITDLGAFAFGSTKWLNALRTKDPMVIVNGLLIDAASVSDQSVTIPSNVKVIGAAAFSFNSQLKSVTIPSSVRVIGAQAFYGCSQLKTAAVKQGTTAIGEFAFYGCKALSEITIPDSVKTIGHTAFGGCSSLASVSVGSSVKNIPDFCFENCSALAQVSLPSAVESIGKHAFYGCPKLDRITVPASVKAIDTRALGYLSQDKKVSGFKILCANGSQAEKYAIDNGFLHGSPVTYERLSGISRFETACEISKKAFPSGAKTVVLASGLDYADALTGSVLAAQNNAPILICEKNSVPKEVMTELERLKPEKVIILGGTGAVSQEVETKIKTKVNSVERLSGKTRFETSAKIAASLSEKTKPDTLFFVYYNGFADAISASSIAGIKGAPLLYVSTNGAMDESIKSYIQSVRSSVKNVYVIGGSGVISHEMKQTIDKETGVASQRLYGANRYDTCLSVCNKFADQFTGSGVCIATGANYPDALTGGVYASLNKLPLMLVDGSIGQAQKEFVSSCSAAKVTVFGGVGAVTDALAKTVCEHCN